MKRTIIICLLEGFFFSFIFSQNGDHPDGGAFLKRVENNLYMKWLYNLSSKGNVEKLFFGEFNAPVEFFHEPSFEGASGFRIVRDSLKKSYTIELKHVSNYEEAQKEASNKYELFGISDLSSTPKDLCDKIREHNSAMTSKYFEELPKLFRIETKALSIGDQFAEKLYKKMGSFIEKFKVKGLPNGIDDGYCVTFRTVVEDEVWSLWIHEPQGNALKMSNLCRQIIADAKENQLDEAKYISVLNTFEDQ